jgi:hypothetical protein
MTTAIRPVWWFSSRGSRKERPNPRGKGKRVSLLASSVQAGALVATSLILRNRRCALRWKNIWANPMRTHDHGGFPRTPAPNGVASKTEKHRADWDFRVDGALTTSGASGSSGAFRSAVQAMTWSTYPRQGHGCVRRAPLPGSGVLLGAGTVRALPAILLRSRLSTRRTMGRCVGTKRNLGRGRVSLRLSMAPVRATASVERR